MAITLVFAGWAMMANGQTFGTVTTLAGNVTIGSSNGVGTVARFNSPFGVAMDAEGSVAIVVSIYLES